MKHIYKKILFLYFLLIVFGCQQNGSENSDSEQTRPTPLFNLLSAQKTGIQFQNTLTEGPNTNVLMYEYFYNGGGVAAGDFNGDGLIDIYFTSNMGDNKLYLNKGNMQFDDATEASGAKGRPGPWKTGVTAVDINGDNKLDIYISYSGALPEAKRANQLYVNQGNDVNGVPVFVEQAEKYGLASTAYSNQAYFFDYDLDGDLDVLLLNHNPNAVPVLNETKTAEILKKDDTSIGVRLFKQTKGFFEDVTLETGISGSALTYGLGIAISDLNNDGWPDFYICNDYTIPDYLYVNNRNGTFTDMTGECLTHISLTSMGNDIADINNDGHMDIITMDMLPEDNRRQKLLMSANNYEKYDLNIRSGFHRQYMRNMLQLNNGNETFSEIGQISGISNTDWSWAVLAADYNNNGWKDMYVTNGYYRDFTNMDFITYMSNYISGKNKLLREDVLELTHKMPVSNIVNYMFENRDGLTFSNTTLSWGLNLSSNSNGAAYADLDNDGDLDLIVNNINQEAFIFENQSEKINNNNYLQVKMEGAGLNTQGIGAKVVIYTGQKSQYLEQTITRGYLSSVSPILHFGLQKEAKVDSLVVTWAKGTQQKIVNIGVNQLLSLNEKNAEPPVSPKKEENNKALFKEIPSPITYQNPTIEGRDFDRQPLLINGLSYSGPCMVKGDVNNDGLEDVFIGGASGQSAVLYFQQNGGRFISQKIPAFANDKLSEDVDATIFDANNDGFPDIYVASGGYHSYGPDDPLLQDRLYINDGKGNFKKSLDALPEMFVSKGCVAAGDVNNDGHIDLFVGGRLIPGRYPETPASYLLLNDGHGKFTDQIKSIAPELQYLGIITDAVWTDMNNDGLKDLVVVGEWLPVSVFINQNGKLENQTLTYFDKEYRGWWNVIEVADFNKDQKPDLFIGNTGTNTQFLVSEEEPAELYFKDFDNNGAVDQIFCYYIQGKSYPYVTRDELTRQMPSLRSRYVNYESYAGNQITDIFPKEELNSAGYLKANHMETSLFISQANGTYKTAKLPLQAQYAPVYTITVFDHNGDGNEDVLLCGNNSHFKLRLGSIKASYGILLQGDGTGDFQYIDQMTSGFKLRGDIRSALKFDSSMLFGVNQGSLIFYKREE